MDEQVEVLPLWSSDATEDGPPWAEEDYPPWLVDAGAPVARSAALLIAEPTCTRFRVRKVMRTGQWVIDRVMYSEPRR